MESVWSKKGSKWRAKSLAALKELYGSTINDHIDPPKGTTKQLKSNMDKGRCPAGDSNGVCMEETQN